MWAKRGRWLVLTSAVIIAALLVAGCSSLLGARPLAFATAAAAPQQPQETKATAPVSAVVREPIPTDDTLADLYERVLPSVVKIQVTKRADISPAIPFGFPFGTPNVPQMGEGSGWVYDTDGHIVTNNHVVDGAGEIVVTFYNGLWAEAEVVATDAQADLAVLKVTPPEGVELRPLPLADPSTLRVGHTVVAIGNPFGLEGTMTVGIVSAMGRSFPIGEETGGRYTLPDVIQTDAAINPGNSGGPLLNLSGEVVGVNFAIESPVRASSGIGFAIPVSIIQRVVPALIEEGKFHYAWLGIAGNDITPMLAKALDLPENTLGAYVQTVTPNGPADEAGLRGGRRVVRLDDGTEVRVGGDIIIAIDDHPVRQFNDLVSYLVTQTSPGQKVTLTILRDGKEMTLEVTLGERPTERVTGAEGRTGLISPRAAISIARDEATRRGLLERPITETIVTSDELNGEPVWVVELSDGRNTVKVTVHAQTGEVLDISSK
ncbi:MAG: trypsin-like peptidase domain-containing protein [Anaerolineae bacterium]